LRSSGRPWKTAYTPYDAIPTRTAEESGGVITILSHAFHHSHTHTLSLCVCVCVC
jgi:hypothetical protein